ncbi:MAG TPA: hypothetical protein VFZ65_00405 [Planctomycetota bacterium]|nr:hypothetical protein [Planctomycetota bacterium]
MHAIVAGSAAGPAERLLAFAVRLRRLRGRGAAASAAMRGALVLAVPCIVVTWIAPVPGLATVAAAFGLLAIAAARAAWRAARIADARLLRAEAGAGAAVVGDELATWLECHRRASAGSPMASWLGREIEQRLPDLPPQLFAALARPRLGRWRRLVPFVALLLFAWLLSLWLWPTWPGALGGRATDDVPAAGSGGGTGGGGGEAGSGAGGAGSPDPAQKAPDAPPAPERQPRGALPPPPPPPPNAAEETPPPEPPAPLLELPEQQRFIVPEFLGDGPTRRARMHAAQLEQGGVAPESPANAGTGGGLLPPPPVPTREQFERAAEQALQARHVPAEEQPMVRHFFELLREAAR